MNEAVKGNMSLIINEIEIRMQLGKLIPFNCGFAEVLIAILCSSTVNRLLVYI